MSFPKGSQISKDEYYLVNYVSQIDVITFENKTYYYLIGILRESQDRNIL